MKIAIYGKQIDSTNKKEVENLLDLLIKKKVSLLFHRSIAHQMKQNGLDKFLNKQYFSTAKELEGKEIDILISIGGDGTFLDTILLIREQPIPVIGVNTGRLGFLSNTPTSEIEKAVDILYHKDFKIEERTLLKMQSNSKLFGSENIALNDISILRSDSSSMITIDVKLDGKHLNTYWADGLIIATATGSTAYSLSCGGPILMPGSGNFVITPIAPHNLNVRPIVVNECSTIDIQVEGRSKRNLVVMDSRTEELKNGESLRITKAKYKLQLIQTESYSFINSLKGKLNWGLDKRNI